MNVRVIALLLIACVMPIAGSIVLHYFPWIDSIAVALTFFGLAVLCVGGALVASHALD